MLLKPKLKAIPVLMKTGMITISKYFLYDYVFLNPETSPIVYNEGEDRITTYIKTSFLKNHNRQIALERSVIENYWGLNQNKYFNESQQTNRVGRVSY